MLSLGRVLLFFALAWPLAAFGGVYRWATVPYLAGSALLALTQTRQIRRLGGGNRWLDLSLAGLLGLAWLQLLPLPPVLLAWISPNAPAVTTATRLIPDTTGWAPISVSPSDTAWACGLLTANVLLFVAARALFSIGGVRATVRHIARLGFLSAALALAQAATDTRSIYWWWVPFSEGATPFGTFVNRNHFATWIIMATGVCFGYVVARLYRSTGNDTVRTWPARLARALEDRSLLLLPASILMSVALFASLSRSGIVGLATAACCMLVAARQQIDASRRRSLTWYAAIAAIIIAVFVDAPGLLARLMETASPGSGRLTIWRETLPIVGDFWIAGTGAGAYETAMLVYQESNHLFNFNHAHNQFLQIVTEGGLLLAVPALVVAMQFVRVARRRIDADRSVVAWLRIGAAAGLAGMTVQSFWETGLRMPANAALAAVLAAIVVHAPGPDRHRNEDSHGTAARI